MFESICLKKANKRNQCKTYVCRKYVIAGHISGNHV